MEEQRLATRRALTGWSFVENQCALELCARFGRNGAMFAIRIEQRDPRRVVHAPSARAGCTCGMIRKAPQQNVRFVVPSELEQGMGLDLFDTEHQVEEPEHVQSL